MYLNQTQSPNSKRVQRGFTLIELLIGLVVASLVVLGVISAWGASIRVAVYTEEAARLNNELRSVMQMVSEDLRRADRGSLVIAPSGQCLTFNVAAPVDKTGPGGSCTVDAASDPECWEPRGYRIVDGSEFQVYVTRGAAPAASCDTNVNWSPLYDGLTAGSFTMTGFEALCRARCYSLADPSATSLATVDRYTIPASLDTLTPEGLVDESVVTERLASCAAIPRCNFAAPASFVEVLSIDLQLSGSVDVSSQARILSLRNTVTIRNNLVQQ